MPHWPAEPGHLVLRVEPWTVEDVLDLPEDRGCRIELVDGALLVSPAPRPGHQRLLQRLLIGFPPVLPAGTELLPGVNVRLGGQRLLIPDFVVMNRSGHSGLNCQAHDLLLAAEIVSPSSRVQDRVLKRQLYAEAGVPFYLLVETDGPAVLFELADGEYRESARSEGGKLTFSQPFAATLDLTR